MSDTVFVNSLRKRGLKATPTRLAVLEMVGKNQNAISLSEIQNELQDFDRVTLYRTLQALTEKGIIHKALEDQTGSYYAMCNEECSTHHHHHEQHVHFKCIKCGEVFCLEISAPVSLKLPGYQVDDFELKASGICENCLN